MIENLFIDDRWTKLQEERSGGVVGFFQIDNSFGKLRYRFIHRYAGNINGTDYYDLVSAYGGGSFSIVSNDPYLLINSFEHEFDTFCLEKNIMIIRI